MSFYIGPLELTFYGNPRFDRQVDTEQVFRLSGTVSKANGEQLRELVENRHRQVTVGRFSGVLEPVWSSSQPSRNGWYLLSDARVSESHMEQLQRWVSFDVTAYRVPDAATLVVIRSARARGNDFGIAAHSLVANPFYDEDPDGSPFVTSPGGTRFSREYDSRTLYDPETPATAGGQLTLYAGLVA